MALIPPPALYSGLLQGNMFQLEASSHPGRPWRARQGSIPHWFPSILCGKQLYPVFLCSLSCDTQGLQDAWSIQLGAVWTGPWPQLTAGAS